MKTRGGYNRRRRRGMSILELTIAMSLSTLVMLGMGSLIWMTSRLLKSTVSQQMSISNAKKAVEGMGNVIRAAVVDTRVQVVDAAGANTLQGNRVLFSLGTEPYGRRSYQLLFGADNDPFTPGDNTLVYDPNTSVAGDQRIVARNLVPDFAATTTAPIYPASCFNYVNATSPLIIRMRAGDPDMSVVPVADRAAVKDKMDAWSGPGFQGVQISIAVAPRN